MPRSEAMLNWVQQGPAGECSGLRKRGSSPVDGYRGEVTRVFGLFVP